MSNGTTGVRLPPAPAGWSIADGPTAYTEESLFEYLNGGAPLYLDYGFQDLTQIRYQMGDDPFASVILDVYDMGSELGAFGLFRTIRPMEAEVENWGAEGYRSGTIAAAWRGAIYVHGEADDDRPELVEIMEFLVAEAVNGVAGSESLPAELAVLPSEGRVQGSERYIATDLFGHAFLPGGFVASYAIEGDEFDLFFSEMPGTPDAEEALGRLRTYENEWGEVDAEITDLGDGGFRFTDPGLGTGLVVRGGNIVAGALGSANADEHVRELLELAPRE